MSNNHCQKLIHSSHQEGLRQAYRQHSAALRAWFVAFGVAFPLFLATNDIMWDQFSHHDNALFTAYLFFAGVVIQVVLAIIDKYADLFCLSASLGFKDANDRAVKFGCWWLRYDSPSIIADVLTLALFIYAGHNTIVILLCR